MLVDLRQHWLEQLISSGQVTRTDVGYTVGFHSILFGDILSIGPAETVAAWALAGVVILWMGMLFKELVFFAFDEETAKAFGVRTNLLYYGLLVLLGLAIVAALRGLGVILASALLALPGASARSLSNRVEMVTLLSALIAVGGLVAGFMISMWLDYLTTGPVIVLTLCVICGLCYGLGKGLRRRRRQ
jgi:ABC-type Mn2+/Zn2+ transport system permease subunit